MTSSLREKYLFLFDVDGTLTLSRQTATKETLEMLRNLKKSVSIGFVGGSDLNKQFEQIGPELLDIFDYGFPENGVQYYKGRDLISSESFVHFLGEEKYTLLVDTILKMLSECKCPVKRGNFIELRQSMLNISPVGRSCTQSERIEFFNYDKTAKVRQRIADELNNLFGDEMSIQCSIGGQISIDIFPRGWDKTYCLRHVSNMNVYFFGDMTEKGGNDYEIFTDKRVVGTKVQNPEDTLVQVNRILEEIKKKQH